MKKSLMKLLKSFGNSPFGMLLGLIIQLIGILVILAGYETIGWNMQQIGFMLIAAAIITRLFFLQKDKCNLKIRYEVLKRTLETIDDTLVNFKQLEQLQVGDTTKDKKLIEKIVDFSGVIILGTAAKNTTTERANIKANMKIKENLEKQIAKKKEEFKLKKIPNKS